MKAHELLIGAYYNGGISAFDHVAIDTTDPPTSFATGLAETYPLSLLNTTPPTGWTAGTGGAAGINRQYKLTMAGEPIMDHPDKSLQDDGINGNDLYVQVASAPRSLSVPILRPNMLVSDTGYNEIWDHLKQLAQRKPTIFILHRSFAATGYISTAPKLFLGEDFSGQIEMKFNFHWFYRPQVVTTVKTYYRFTV